MSTNPNKLAWKGTPGPWNASKTGTMRGPVHMGVINSTTDGYQTVADVFGNHQAKMEANMHVISAAPEAIGFISDLLVIMDAENCTLGMLKREILKGEEILKKAYNF